MKCLHIGVAMQYLKQYGWAAQTGYTNAELNEVVAPHLEGNDDFASGNKALYVKAFST